MRSDLHYITKSEFTLRIVIYVYYLILLIFGRPTVLWLYILTIFLLLCGSFIRILSFNKKVFVNTPKAEGFYKVSRHPMLFSYLFYSFPIIIFLGINFFSISLYILFIFFIYMAFSSSERFYEKLYSQNVVYKSNIPAFFPNVKIYMKDLFKKGEKSLVDTYEIIPALIPLLVVIFIEHLGIAKFIRIIKNFFI